MYMDHKNLIYFTTTKTLNRRQVRWAEELSKYDFKIVYQKKSENGRADALSQGADHFDGTENLDKAILKNSKDDFYYNPGYFIATTKVENDESLMDKIIKA